MCTYFDKKLKDIKKTRCNGTDIIFLVINTIRVILDTVGILENLQNILKEEKYFFLAALLSLL